jgi:N-acetylmuramoyl-L-alanine amidase
MLWSKPLLKACAAGGLLALVCGISSAVPQAHTPAPATSARSAAIPSPTPTAGKTPSPDFFVLIDPSHGGDDKGAVLAPRIFEKDLTLSLARVLRKELEERGIAARLLRDSDTGIALEHRAELCNEQRPSLYIALHAGEPGRGVRVYSALLPSPQPSVGNFLPWDSAQAGALERSNAVARAVARELQKRDLKTLDLQALLRPLNNIVAPAIAVELATSRADIRSLANPKLQSVVAEAVADAVEENRNHLGERK